MLFSIVATTGPIAHEKVERAASPVGKASDQRPEAVQAQSWQVHLSERAQQLGADLFEYGKTAGENVYQYSQQAVEAAKNLFHAEDSGLDPKSADLFSKADQRLEELILQNENAQPPVFSAQDVELRRKAEDYYSNGLALATGQRGERLDMTKAAHYLKISASLGHPLALYQYATLQGEGSEPDMNKAIAYVKIAADQGVAIAKDHYEMATRFDQALKLGPVEAPPVQKRLADEGEKFAQLIYATMRKVGDVFGEINLPEARQYFKSSADQGLAIAQEEYARMVDTGEGGEANRPEAIVYFQKSATQGNLDAMRWLTQRAQALVPSEEIIETGRSEL